MQKLIMPHQDTSQMLCGYKNAEYRKYWGYNHFGVDISARQGKSIGSEKIVASGNGTVIETGYDNSGGNILVIRYNQVYNHKTKEVYDVVARYMHLESSLVKKGDKVIQGQVIAIEGKTKTADYHLHIEFDRDVKNPMYSPQVSSHDDWKSKVQGNYLLHGYTDSRDTTVNPSYLFYIGKGQTLAKPSYNPAWLNTEDFVIPKLEVDAETDKYKIAIEKIKDILKDL